MTNIEPSSFDKFDKSDKSDEFNELKNLLCLMNSTDNSNVYRSSDLLKLSEKIYQLEINNIETFESDKFKIIKKFVTLSDNNKRSYLIKSSKVSNSFEQNNSSKCIFFFHGSRDLHWDVALNSTELLHEDFITVYFQGNNQGVFNLEYPHLHQHYGYITYGENFFEIRDYTNNFNEDIEYIKLVKSDISNHYNINDFYAVGHSNGGVFVCLFPVYLPGQFKKIVSHQGGIGWDEWFNIPFEKLDQFNKRIERMYFYTGSEDVHLIPCKQAHQLFINEGYPSEFFCEPGLKHMWVKSCEPKIFNWLGYD